MNRRYYWLIAGVSTTLFCVGLIVAAFRYELLICTASIEKISEEVRQVQAERKKIDCVYISHGAIKHEQVDVLYVPVMSKTVAHICNAWLQVVYDEQLLTMPVSVQHVAASSGQTTDYYVSFDRYPFEKSVAIQAKIELIAGLLATLTNAGIAYKRIFFMVNGQTLEDDHLDFSHGWRPVASLDHYLG